jgi:hypothetical protein
MPSTRVSRLGFAATVLLISVSALAATKDQGVWIKHDTNFQFLGFTTTYSCDGLADKLKSLLFAAGARRDAKAISGACSNGYGRPDKFAGARLMFYTLEPAASADSANAPVSGMWRTVLFADRSPRDLRLGDCELVEQFRDKVLPLFTTRNVENGMTCLPNQLSGSVIRLKFEVFAGKLP